MLIILWNRGLPGAQWSPSLPIIEPVVMQRQKQRQWDRRTEPTGVRTVWWFDEGLTCDLTSSSGLFCFLLFQLTTDPGRQQLSSCLICSAPRCCFTVGSFSAPEFLSLVLLVLRRCHAAEMTPQAGLSNRTPLLMNVFSETVRMLRMLWVNASSNKTFWSPCSTLQVVRAEHKLYSW